MANIIEFPVQYAEQDDEPMTREELEDELAHLKAMIAVLDKKEPKDMESQAHEVWAEQHETLEDQIDEIMEILEQI